MSCAKRFLARERDLLGWQITARTIDEINLSEGMMSKHICHARNCEVSVPPKLFMCKKHWYMVPFSYRKLIWALYRPGQEVDKVPAKRYLEVVSEAINIVAKKESSNGNK